MYEDVPEWSAFLNRMPRFVLIRRIELEPFRPLFCIFIVTVAHENLVATHAGLLMCA
jgi:hypothetical protein